MQAYRIKILKSTLSTYWYANSINQQFWAEIPDENDYNVSLHGFRLVSTTPHASTDYVNYNDCEIIRRAFIELQPITAYEIVEL